MNTFWKSLSNKLLLIFSSVVFMGQQVQQPSQLTRADGPGFDFLAAAKVLRTAEKYPEAAAKALEASTVFQQSGNWTAWADAYNEAYMNSRRFSSDSGRKQLLEQFRAAASVVQSTANMPDVAQAIIWGRTGFLHHDLGEYDLAVPLYEKAIPFAEKAGDTSYIIRLYGSAAILLWEQGDNYRALDYHEQALELSAARRDTAMIVAISTNLGNVWRSIDPAKAIPFYTAALALDPRNSQSLMLLSKAYEESGNHTRALETAQSALRLATDDYEKADAFHQLGRVYSSLRQYERALGHYRKSYALASGSYGPTHPECAKIAVFTGRVYTAQYKFDAALTAFNQTLNALLPLFNPDNPQQNPAEDELTTISLWVLDALNGKAETYRKQYQISQSVTDLEQSLACAELALAYLQKIKLRYGDDNSKIQINSYVQSSCEAAVGAAFALLRHTGNQEYAARAFRISEQTRAVVLAEALYKKEVKQIAGVPAALLESERKWHTEIAYFEKKLMDSEHPADRDSLFRAKRQREDLEKQIATQYPVYSEAISGYRNTVTPDSVQRQLPSDAALVEYFFGDSTLYTFLITADTFWVESKPVPAGFYAAAGAFRQAVSDWQFVQDSSATAGRNFLKTSYLLYQWLLEKPLSVTDKKRLFVVPDGVLHYLPFDLLLTQPYTGQWIDRDMPYLLKDRSVSYRFSCRRAAGHHRLSEGWGGFGLEYDDATLSAIESTGEEITDGIALRNNGKLPFADDEILAVSGMIGGAFWLNQSATRENFLDNAGKYGILHLAMHGFVDEKNPLQSRLLFSRSASGDDPFVYASDLYNLQLTSGLAVLSACQSGTGTLQRGEGVMSLARAFAFAGCSSLVTSLWNVSDQSTSGLMVDFYKGLKAGKTKDAALREAKLHYLESASSEYAKPVYWASFIPIGEMDAMPEGYFETRSYFWWWALGAAVVLAALLVWKGRRFF